MSNGLEIGRSTTRNPVLILVQRFINSCQAQQSCSRRLRALLHRVTPLCVGDFPLKGALALNSIGSLLDRLLQPQYSCISSKPTDLILTFRLIIKLAFRTQLRESLPDQLLQPQYSSYISSKPRDLTLTFRLIVKLAFRAPPP